MLDKISSAPDEESPSVDPFRQLCMVLLIDPPDPLKKISPFCRCMSTMVENEMMHARMLMRSLCEVSTKILVQESGLLSPEPG